MPTLFRALPAVVLLLVVATAASAQTDRVRTLTGSVVGRVTGVTKLAVTVETSGADRSTPVTEIRNVLFGDEPAALSQARINAENGGYATALEKLATLSPRDLENPLVRAELAYYLAYCEARLAVVGERPAAEASRRMRAFLRDYPDSHHYYPAMEALGDLFLSAGQVENAEKAYDLISQAPLPAFRLRAGVLAGKASQAQEKHAEAIERFDAVLAESAGGAPAERLEATLGKASSLAATGRLEEGLALARGVLRDADPEDAALQAAGYNTLGRCYEASGQTLDALFAFLHTDLLFNADAESHAEALARLAPLWEATGRPEEGEEARRRLQRRYAQTRWARESR